MNSANILDPIWASYLTTIDCLKVASRSIEKGELHLMSNTIFAASAIDEAKMMIKESRTSADDFVIVSLWAVFERKLLEYVQEEGRRLLQTEPTNFNKQVYEKIDNEMEYWKTDDILDLFKAIVSADLIGKAKQVKNYRNWIAHKNPKKTPANVPPATAYRDLSAIVQAVEQHPELKQAATTT